MSHLAEHTARVGVIVVLVLLGLLAAHSGAWVVFATASFGALAGLGASDQVGLRFAGVLAGALSGGIVGVAAHYAAQRPTPSFFPPLPSPPLSLPPFLPLLSSPPLTLPLTPPLPPSPPLLPPPPPPPPSPPPPPPPLLLLVSPLCRRPA